MATATSQPNVYIQTFESIVRHLAQQEVTRLRPHVTERSAQSESHNWERLASSVATQKTSRLTDTPDGTTNATPNASTVWSRRVSVAQTWHNGDSTEQEDPSQMLVDPNSNLAMSLAYSMRRAMDDIIINAATGNALDGDGNNQAFPAGQTIGTGAGTGPITFDLITQVQEKFLQNDIGMDVPKVAIIGPTQVRKLMQLTEQTSSDYVGVRDRGQLQQLADTGVAPNWMGFTWVMSTRLLGTPATDIRCLFFTKRAIGLHVARDINARIAEDPAFSFAWRIYCQFVAGAVRVEDEHIVQLYCADTV